MNNNKIKLNTEKHPEKHLLWLEFVVVPYITSEVKTLKDGKRVGYGYGTVTIRHKSLNGYIGKKLRVKIYEE